MGYHILLELLLKKLWSVALLSELFTERLKRVNILHKCVD